MAAESKKKTIGSVEYDVTQLMWGEANALFGRITQALGPALGKLMSGDMKSILLGDSDVGPAISQLAADLTADDIIFIRDKVIQNNSVKYRAQNGWPAIDAGQWEILFTGKYFESMQLLMFALEVNFGDFLGGVRSVIAGRGGPSQKDPPSSNPQPG